MRRRRARDIGIPFDGRTGPHNAITDVRGLEVGFATLVEGHGSLAVGMGPVRTGVTAVWPRGKDSDQGSFASWQTLHGNGEMTGSLYVDDQGWLQPGPVMITNTLSVGTVHEAVIRWQTERDRRLTSLPVVAETWDGYLNDIRGLHVRAEHVFAAHFSREFTTSDTGVTQHLVMSDVEAPGFLGFFSQRFGNSKMGNAFLKASKDYLEQQGH